MLEPRLYIWNQFNDLVVDDMADDKISEEEAERRLDEAEDMDLGQLMYYARTLGYDLRLPIEDF